eukprot:CAMPEP_0116873966 /NCGR_PEP_ID=MMETSP0463-20121206/5324_1 /TAXON_ID=181622 /ORGANISM="Strombidinopsis sp, Strain SopsisLIS2011" /LENGTH=61 /DNA_ID=CAMNT_0004516931 /DNA_START=1579 /DNA_END=1764 /DNA_ORIENTATION=+
MYIDDDQMILAFLIMFVDCVLIGMSLYDIAQARQLQASLQEYSQLQEVNTNEDEEDIEDND